MRSHGHLAPADAAGRPRLAEHEDIDDRHGDHGGEHGKHLGNRQADAHLRFHEIPEHAQGDDEKRRGGENEELRGVSLGGPRHGGLLVPAPVEQEADVGGEDEDVHGRILGRPHNHNV